MKAIIVLLSVCCTVLTCPTSSADIDKQRVLAQEIPLTAPYTSAFLIVSYTTSPSLTSAVLVASTGICAAYLAGHYHARDNTIWFVTRTFYTRAYHFRIDDVAAKFIATLTGYFTGFTVTAPKYQLSPADVNFDNKVNILDLIAVRNRLNVPLATAGAEHDVNRDGTIDVLDLIAIRNALNSL